jgi:hypothetical protein
MDQVANNIALNVKNTTNNSLRWLKQNQVLFIIVILVVLAIGLFFLLSLYRSFRKFSDVNIYLVKGTINAGSGAPTIPNSSIPRAHDGPYGLEFSYSMWLYINQDSFSATNKTVRKHILHKGNPELVPYMCPGIFLSDEKNDLEVHFTTFNYTDETCKVSNIPIAKWFHLAVVVINKNVDIYINGQLKKRCTLRGLPIQNFGDLYITREITTPSTQADTAPSVQFTSMKGMLSQVRYFSYALPYYRLEQVMNESPADAPPAVEGEMPPYLAANYYLQTGFPSAHSTSA